MQVKAVQTEGKPIRKRRSFTRAFKQDLVEQTLVPGASISGIALANGLNTNQLFKWRRQMLAHAPNRSAVLLPVEIEGSAPMTVNSAAVAPLTEPTPPSAHIEIAALHAKVRLHGQVDPAALRTVLHWLAR